MSVLNALHGLDAKSVGLVLLAVAAANALLAFWLWTRHDSSIAAHFSPKGGCATAIVTELNRARSEILVMAYSFSCPDIANALIAASGRGVRVAVLLDRSNEAESYSELGDLRKHKIDVLIDAQHAIAHNKVIIIDRRIVLTGSFNFTRQAEHENAENLLILRHHHDLVERYRDNFHAHRDHCVPPGTAHAGHTATHTHLGAAAHSRHATA